MIEFLIIASCFHGTAKSCEQGAQAYYVQSGIEENVSKKGIHYTKKYPLMSNIVGYTAAAAQGIAVINLTSGKSLTLDGKNSILSFKGEF